MKIVVWKTGHEIADRVAQALGAGLNGEIKSTNDFHGSFSKFQTNIAYGILRGTSRVFNESEIWFNVDRGYFNPGHYDGYYRISYRGTQSKYIEGFASEPSGVGLEPIRSLDYTKDILVCPPTDEVCKFFNINKHNWLSEKTRAYCHYEPNGKERIWWAGSRSGASGGKYILRNKGDVNPIDWDRYYAVITFNSSVGWETVRRGIPCISDPNHSVVGSYYNTSSLDELLEKFKTMPREPLFDFMRAHQFTLKEISEGKAWPLINHYLEKYNERT